MAPTYKPPLSTEPAKTRASRTKDPYALRNPPAPAQTAQERAQALKGFAARREAMKRARALLGGPQ